MSLRLLTGKSVEYLATGDHHLGRPCAVSQALEHRRRARLHVRVPSAENRTHISKAADLGAERLSVEGTISRIRSIVATREELVSFENNFNVALLVWRLIASLKPGNRPTLVDRLTSRDIKDLWQLAAARYAALPADLQTSLGAWKSPWNDMPTDKGQETIYQGKAAVPLSGLAGRFQKAFFLHPESYELYGRVRLQPSLLGDALYPLYFKCTPKQTVIPDTGELADMSLEYLSGDRLDLQPEHLPQQARWPQPALDHRWPFNGGLTDYARPVGPGVYVGRGWKRSEGRSRGQEFLYFIMAAQADSQ